MRAVFKRLICLILVFALILTMPGCAMVEGRRVSVIEALFHIAVELGSVLLDLAVYGSAALALWILDLVFIPLEKLTGDIWVDLDEVGPDVGAWLTNKMHPEDNIEGKEYPFPKLINIKPGIGSVTEEQPRYEGDGLPQTGSDGRDLENGDKAPFPEGQEVKTNFIGSLFGCKHELKYNEKKNILKCWCGANKFTAQDVPDWDYDTFCACLPDLKSKHEQKSMESFMKFQGLNKGLFELMEKLEKATPDEINLEKMNALTELIEKVKVGNTVYVNYMGTPELIDDAAKFDESLGNTLTAVSGLIHINQLIDSRENISKACDEYIETVKTGVGTVTSATGGTNAFLLVGLDSLKPVLKAYIKGADEVQNRYNVLGIVVQGEDKEFTSTWADMINPTYNWDDRITFEHIVGLQKVDGLKLPTLDEAVNTYPHLSECGKAVADRYILYCMNYVFKDVLGITYEQYINFVSEL